MPRSDSPTPDPLEGELAEPPPSDLSDYTWDDSETEQYDPDQSLTPRAEASVAGASRGMADDADTRRFVDAILGNRLLSESEVRNLQGQLARGGMPASLQDLSAELVRLGRLTKYQVAAIRQGKTRGLVLGSYLVLEKIGSGGMGLVFKARHRQLNRVVALKLLPPSISRDRAAVIRFRREVAAVANLRHPNIVAALDAGETGGLLYFVMELVDGKDMARLVKEKGPMPVNRALDCILHAARGMQEAHKNGVIHRDIKPANLLLDQSGMVKVLDLGLARVSQGQDPLTADSSDMNLTVSGSFVGTVDYMSPEQAYDPRLADSRSDIYSLGCTLHYLLTGKAPYGGQTFMERLLAHRERPIPTLSCGRSDIPPALDAFFRRLLAKSPQARPQSMNEVIQCLPACRASDASTASGGPKRKPSPRDAIDEDPGSIYDMADSVLMPAMSRPAAANNVFVRSRGSNSEWTAGPASQRRRRRRLVVRLMVLATVAAAGWYLALRYGWLTRR